MSARLDLGEPAAWGFAAGPIPRGSEVGRQCQFAPAGEFGRNVAILRLDALHGVAAQRQAQRPAIRML
ncbi:hypothetical protein ACQVBX_01165 [Dyella sp. KULCS107]|uniref:hypothetical protein n=1 Tax=Dyella sp. KULCS107 TaxID=3422216 RepID=UPI003D700C46